MSISSRKTCRVCASRDLLPLFSLGTQAVSDFVTADRVHAGVRCPLELVLCGRCALVQLRHTAPAEFLYTRHYWYASGRNATMRAALADVVRAALHRVALAPGDVVLDIGSNDGTLLRAWKELCPGVVTVGVEPARNFAEEGRKGADVFVDDFWPSEAIQSTRARVITACGMFYDLEDPNAFIRAVARVLAPGGLFVAQLQCLKQTYELADVGNFCHEHLEYYSLASLQWLFGRHGLEICDIEENDVNGGSYRLFVRHTSSYVGNGPEAAERVRLACQHEDEMRLAEPAIYADLFARMKVNRDECVRFLHAEKARGKRIWIYGASTKGNVLLQWYGLDGTLIAGAADRAPEKDGLWTVASGINIVPEEVFRRANPDYALVLPYAFRAEFLERERDWRQGGGKFIFALPRFEVV